MHHPSVPLSVVVANSSSWFGVVVVSRLLHFCGFTSKSNCNRHCSVPLIQYTWLVTANTADKPENDAAANDLRVFHLSDQSNSIRQEAPIRYMRTTGWSGERATRVRVSHIGKVASCLYGWFKGKWNLQGPIGSRSYAPKEGT